jgi:hypothetical protein
MSSPASSPSPPFCGDARDDLNASAANKEKLALNHFNYFLKTYSVQISVAAVEASSIPYEGLGIGQSHPARQCLSFGI